MTHHSIVIQVKLNTWSLFSFWILWSHWNNRDYLAQGFLFKTKGFSSLLYYSLRASWFGCVYLLSLLNRGVLLRYWLLSFDNYDSWSLQQPGSVVLCSCDFSYCCLLIGRSALCIYMFLFSYWSAFVICFYSPRGLTKLQQDRDLWVLLHLLGERASDTDSCIWSCLSQDESSFIHLNFFFVIKENRRALPLGSLF